jgi:hypothetical protein
MIVDHVPDFFIIPVDVVSILGRYGFGGLRNHVLRRALKGHQLLHANLDIILLHPFF